MPARPLKPGQRARRTRVVRHRDIERFTELTGDRNLLHYDVAEELPGPGSVFLHVDCSFGAPVRPGDSITAEVEVLEVRPDKPIAKLRTTITKQDGAAVLDGEALVWIEPV